MIKIEGLTILFDSFQITDLNIVIEEGEFHSLLGPTGCGKTLVLESIIGLRKPTKSKIWIGEREVQDSPPEQREISYVPQDLALFPHLKVRENILFGIKARNLDPGSYEEYIGHLIQEMKVGHLLERYPANLSGGEKKRVALLRALVPRPKLLLLDEPLSGLDPSIKLEIEELLKTLHAVFHPTILCVTHDFEEAYYFSDRITIFMDGKVEQVGEKDHIFLRPRSKKVAQFLGARNLYRAKVLKRDGDSGRSTLTVNDLLFSVPVPASGDSMEEGREIDLFIRPEEVMIIREGKPVKESLRRNILSGRIVDIANNRRHHTVHLLTIEGEVPIEISIPNYAFRNLDLREGKIVRMALREESFWMMT